MNMEKKIFIKSFFILFLFLSFLFADAIITEFSADPDGERIVLQWKTSQEDNVQKFVVERSNDKEHFYPIGSLEARGPGYQYRFVDDRLGKINGWFYYRLQIVNKNGNSTYNEPIQANLNISSISRTWGSIKALFR